MVTEYRSVPGAKRMVYPQVRQSGCLKRTALRRMPQLEAREFIHVYFTDKPDRACLKSDAGEITDGRGKETVKR